MPPDLLRVYLCVVVLALPVMVQTAEYHCKAEKKFDRDSLYPPEAMDKGQFSVQIEDKGETAYVSRCSFAPSQQKVTWDRYHMDKVAFDEHAKIKKYYLFRSQFDVQLFPDLSFVENNGRGSIAYGRCRLIAP